MKGVEAGTDEREEGSQNGSKGAPGDMYQVVSIAVDQLVQLLHERISQRFSLTLARRGHFLRMS